MVHSYEKCTLLPAQVITLVNTQRDNKLFASNKQTDKSPKTMFICRVEEQGPSITLLRTQNKTSIQESIHSFENNANCTHTHTWE